MDNVSKGENIEVNKCITANSFGMDISVLKAPMFIYNNYKPEKDEKGNIVSKIEERTFEWIDSKNLARKLYMYCKGRLPRQFESDVLFALVGLFIRKNAPFAYDEVNKKYNVNVSKVEFSWYELAAFLNVPSTGYYIERMKDAVRILKQTQYFSYDNGVLYDKKNTKYVQSGEEGLSLLTKYKFKTTKTVAESDEYDTGIDNNFVIFDELILDNLRYEYFKFLNIDIYFDKIPSGIERGIYGYLEANRYDENGQSLKYIKRKYDTLKVGIPVDFEYVSDLKKRLTKPLNHLKEIGYLKDYAYGDVLKVNGEKELCVYFCFDMSSQEVKQMLERKKMQQLKLNLDIVSKDENKNNVSKAENNYLKLPEKSLIDELVDRGIDRNATYELFTSQDKWQIIKYLLWFDKQKIEGKNPKPGLLRFAIEKSYDIDVAYSDIVSFINDSRKQEEQNKAKKTKDIKTLYDRYIEDSIDQFKNEEQETYDIFFETTLTNLEKIADKKLKETKLVGGDVSKIEEFLKKKTESEWFKELLIKDIKMYRGLKSYEEFKSSIEV